MFFMHTGLKTIVIVTQNPELPHFKTLINWSGGEKKTDLYVNPQ